MSGEWWVFSPRSLRSAHAGAAPAAPTHAPHPHPLCRQIYNEYYQWQNPTRNQNSASHVVKPGDELYGSITYEPQTNS
jgi:hypothetical protein